MMTREWLATVATTDSFTGCFTGDEGCDARLMQARVSRFSGGSYGVDIDDDTVRDGTLTAEVELLSRFASMRTDTLMHR